MKYLHYFSILIIFCNSTVKASFDKCEKIDEDCPEGCIGYEGIINFTAILKISPKHFKQEFIAN